MNPTLRQAMDLVEETTRGLSVDQLSRHVPGKWSIAEILEHLVMAFDGTASAAERALTEGTPRTRPPGLKEFLARTLVIDIGYFPRVKAPKEAQPAGAIPAAQAVQALRAAIASADDAFARAAARFGERTPVVNHPYFGGLSVDQWRRFHLRHTEHHMKQVRERT